MSIKLKDSKLWESERGHSAGKPYKTFKLEDPTFFGIHSLHIYRDDKHWNWVYWDIAKHDHRPPSGLGFATPERAAIHVVRHLVRNATEALNRAEKLLRDTE